MPYEKPEHPARCDVDAKRQVGAILLRDDLLQLVGRARRHRDDRGLGLGALLLLDRQDGHLQRVPTRMIGDGSTTAT